MAMIACDSLGRVGFLGPTTSATMVKSSAPWSSDWDDPPNGGGNGGGGAAALLQLGRMEIVRHTCTMHP